MLNNSGSDSRNGSVNRMRPPRLRSHHTVSRRLAEERSAPTEMGFSTEPLPLTTQTAEHWPTFEEILTRLHQEGIYIHAEQLAEFFLTHGLPVHLQYVPAHLQEKARAINENYQGDMARLEEF